MFKAAIFDLDGTLADTIESIATAANKSLVAVGLEPRKMEEYNYYAGDGADTLIRRALVAAGDKKLEKFEEAYGIYKEFFETDCTYKVKEFLGMRETLNQLKERGIKVAVLTNKPHERAIQVVDHLFGPNYFDLVIGQQDSIPKKPDPTGALMIARRFGINPQECMYIGDTNVDMITGKSAAMFTIGVLWGFRPKEELERYEAEAIISTPNEILTLV